ncbi:MAG: hypothetical protein JKY50_03905 [Oleispira sp.]|nr:hypothetical protein [Oleispira sp.]
MKYLLICTTFYVCVASLVGCGNTFSEMEGVELRERSYHCLAEASSTAAELQVCENIRRECQRRQEAGEFDC